MLEITSPRDSRRDIIAYDDGFFWRFREEFDQGFLRTLDYRVIEHGTEEWQKFVAVRDGLL